MLVAVPVFVAQAATAPLTFVGQPEFTFVVDEGGPDDLPGQKDLTAQAVATPTPGDLWVAWKFDDTAISGGNTADGCALFDNDTNSRVDFAVCVTIGGTPTATQLAGSPRVYTCGDTKVDRCTSPNPQVVPVPPAVLGTVCKTESATDTFPLSSFPTRKKTEQDRVNDTRAICHVDLTDVGGSEAVKTSLINTCSYPSMEPTSAPSDCVLIPRDAFIIIQKTATPDTGLFPFRVGTGGASSNPVVFTASGTETSDPIAVRSGVTLAVKEDTPANWAIDTPTPSCTGASGSGTSSGTTSGDTIGGIKLASDNVLTCSYNNKQLTGAIRITKKRSGSDTVLAGAHFTVDGSGDHVTGSNGTVCIDGLTLGSHEVVETTAPNGHSLPSDTSETVNVTAAATCSLGTPATVTFNDPLVLGTINILKTDEDNEPLGGATFTLYNDNPTVGGARTAGDTITNLSCTTQVADGPNEGKCTISNVPLGEYFLVETTAPDGYTKAADRHITIDVGTTPGNGDVENRTIGDTPAPGTIVIHKKGRNNLPLPGAVFTLYARTGLEEEHNPGATPLGSCTSSDPEGDCIIEDVPPGDYWLVETTTPAGYETVDDVSITVGLGSDPEEGDTVELPIADPVVPGSITINKTGISGALDGATFTLYVDTDPSGGTFVPGTDPAVVPAKSCTTGDGTVDGSCTINDVPLGHYWLVETGVPNGYSAAPPQKVEIALGATADNGDSEARDFVDAAVPGTVNITKTDDADNPLEGAEFTLYVNIDPLAGPRGNGDTITTKTCVTDADGTCSISSVPLGSYWLVETQVPDADYVKADDKPIVVGLGDAPNTGDTVSESFVNERKHRVVVVVCHEGTDTLFSRDVTVGGVTKQSLPAGSLSGTQQKALCDTDGASFGRIVGHGKVGAEVDLGANSATP